MKLILALFISITSFAHCPIEFSSENLCASLEWTSGPVLNENSSFELNFWRKGDSEHVGISPEADLNMFTWMVMGNSHSHRGPMITWEEVSPGKFVVSDARFFMHGMKGHWEVRLQLEEWGDLVEEKSIKVDLSGDGQDGGHHH